MSLSAKLRRAPLRAVTGAFIAASGVDKLKADEETAKRLHGFTSGTYPFVGKVDPKLYAKALGAGEVALGGALLLPIVSPVVAGVGLMGFSAALLNVYWNTPGMHEDGSPKPTQAGIPLAKDVWMLGVGAGLVVDGLLSPAHDKHVELASTVHEKRSRKAKQSRKAKKAAKKARAEAKSHAIEAARGAQADFTKRARKAAKRAQKSDAMKRAQQASDKAAKRLSEARDEYGPLAVEKGRAARKAARRAAEEYGPLVAEKAKQARSAAKDARDEYGPLVAERAKQARDAYGPVVAERAKQARDAAMDARDAYGPVVAERAKQARDAAMEARDAARDAAQSAAERAQNAMR